MTPTTVTYHCACGAPVTIELTRGPETTDENGNPTVTVYLDAATLEHHHDISEAHDG